MKFPFFWSGSGKLFNIWPVGIRFRIRNTNFTVGIRFQIHNTDFTVGIQVRIRNIDFTVEIRFWIRNTDFTVGIQFWIRNTDFTVGIRFRIRNTNFTVGIRFRIRNTDFTVGIRIWIKTFRIRDTDLLPGQSHRLFYIENNKEKNNWFFSFTVSVIGRGIPSTFRIWSTVLVMFLSSCHTLLSDNK